MERYHMGKDRRAFVRYEHNRPMHYSLVASPGDKTLISRAVSAISKNISASGILFETDKEHIPDLSSLLILDLDYRTAKACADLEDRALIVNNKLLGKVVRIERKDSENVDVGVAFINKSDRLSEDIRKLV